MLGIVRPQPQPDNAQPQPDNAQPSQFGAVRNVQIAVQEFGAVWKDVEKEKYGKRMISMSIFSGLMCFFTMTFLYRRIPARVSVPVSILMLLGPALPAVAATKAKQKKGLIRCFCCCTFLVSSVHFFFMMIYGAFLLAILQIQFFYSECGPELCNPSAEVTQGRQFFSEMNEWMMVDCFATGIWEGYEQASESQWDASLDSIGLNGHSELARTIVSNQKKYSDHECTIASWFVDCPDLFFDGNSPPNGEAMQVCQLDNENIQLWPHLAHGWAAPGLMLIGLFLHSSMTLMLICGCLAGRKLRQRDEAEVEMAML